MELAVCVLAAIVLALTIGFPFQTISQVLIKSSLNNIFDGQNAITEGEAVTKNVTESNSVTTELNQIEEIILIPNRRVSWSSKINDNDVDSVVRRPLTPIWKKDEVENSHSFWGDHDDSVVQEDLLDRSV